MNQRNVRQLFVVTAALEVGAGLALLIAPAFVVRLVFGAAVEVPAVGIARLAGVALVSLAAACWRARDDERSVASNAIVAAMLMYNAAVVVLVLFGGLGPLGPLQWAAVGLHGAMAIWCAVASFIAAPE